MKVLIAGSIQGDGGYEEETLCRMLETRLLQLGYETDCFFLPYERNILSLPEQLLAYQLMQVSGCDLLITVGFPACVLRHTNKVCYLLQVEPMLAEYWDSQYGVIANYQYSNIFYTANHIIREALLEAESVFCDSRLLAEDLTARFQVPARYLLYPVLEPNEGEATAGDAPYILCETCLLPWQRVELLPKLAEGGEVRVYVPNSNRIYREYLSQLVREEQRQEAVKIFGRRASRAEIEAAEGIFCSDYAVRRVPNIVLCGIKYEKPIAALRDGGAAAELLPERSRLKRDGLPDLFRQISRCSKAETVLLEPEKFIKELLGE